MDILRERYLAAIRELYGDEDAVADGTAFAFPSAPTKRPRAKQPRQQRSPKSHWKTQSPGKLAAARTP